jgi:hypothetical protein
MNSFIFLVPAAEVCECTGELTVICGYAYLFSQLHMKLLWPCKFLPTVPLGILVWLILFCPDWITCERIGV